MSAAYFLKRCTLLRGCGVSTGTLISGTGWSVTLSVSKSWILTVFGFVLIFFRCVYLLVDLELFYGKLADEAESGFKKNILRPAYRAIKRLRGSTRSSANGSVARSDGSLCNTRAEITERWREHYQNTLNHSNVTPSADLDDFADSASPDVTVSEDVPMLHEVTRAIRRLKNGRAARADGITA